VTANLSEELLDRLSTYVAERMGLHFSPERRRDLERGLLRAAPEFGFSDAEACARWLLLAPLTKAQVEILASHLSVGETYFFRDEKLFELLESRIFPELIQKRRDAGRHLRIWSAGCASGEEPYSVAILLRRMLHDIDDWNLTILATDINPSFLRKASQGVYGEWSFRGVPSWIKERYFRRTVQDRFEILADMRKHVTFSYHNLAEDQYPSLLNNTNAMDIILCRNVLMYFAGDRQREVVNKFHHCLVDGGCLFVSPTEISTALFSPFVPVSFPGATLYRKDLSATVSPACRMPREPLPFQAASEALPSIPDAAPALPLPDANAGTPAVEPVKPEDRTGFVRTPVDPYQEALAAYERGCYAEAEVQATALLSRTDNHAPALALLSRLRANAGLLPEARELCEKAVAADKLNPGYHYLLAMVLQELGDPHESAASLKRALYLDQNFALAHFSLGNLSLRQGKDREAARHFGNALSVLRTLRRDELLPESEGVTAGRMEEIIRTTMREEASA
jgi:chemotaxis protein methyltransferase CheR